VQEYPSNPPVDTKKRLSGRWEKVETIDILRAKYAMFSNAIKRNIVKACASKSKLPLSKTLLAGTSQIT